MEKVEFELMRLKQDVKKQSPVVVLGSQTTRKVI